MNLLFREFLKAGLDSAARENVRTSPQVACFAHDIIGRKIMIDGVFEKRELLALERLLRAGSAPRRTCLDVGANIGNHALFLAGLFEEVLAFEPNRRTFRLLELNAELAPNVRAFNLGLSDRAAELPARMERLNVGGARIVSDGEADTTFRVVTLDAFLADRPDVHVDFVKIDVEGHEAQALAGARETLARHRPMLAMEMNVRKEPEPNAAVLDRLDEQGYRVAYLLKASPPWLGTPSFRPMPFAEFRRLRAKNHKMVLFAHEPA
jgi:FkbM family methyltransferase